MHQYYISVVCVLLDSVVTL